MDFDRDTRLRFYRTMHRIRRFEETIVDQYRRGNVPGFLHLSPGQEAIAVGACSQLRPDDYVTSTHRGHGHCIAKGAPHRPHDGRAVRPVGRLLPRQGRLHAHRRLRPGHPGRERHRRLGPASWPSARPSPPSYRGTDQVTVCFFGDGASNQGTFHEGLNMASLWKLPVVFICENNCYAESTRQCEHQAVKDVAERAAGYGMPGVIVDGNDVEAVYEVVAAAVARARAGEGPTLIEAKTYRQRGHHEGDPATYRTKEEVDGWLERCPVKCYREALLRDGVATEAELAAIEAATEDEMRAALAFALASPLPDVSTARDGIFTETAEVAR